MTIDISQPDLPGFLRGGGPTGLAIMGVDWARSAIGPVESWPQSLRTAVNIMINSKQPMFLAWGRDLTFIYNQAYAPILGRKHPTALGRPMREVWSDIWDDIKPLIDQALAGEATWADDLHLVMDRNGYSEDTWYTFSYSPLRSDDDSVGGMFCSCIETTSQVLAARQSIAERERLFAMTRDLFGVATLGGNFRTLNPAWSRVLGRPLEDLLANPFTDIIHPDDLGVTADVVAQLQQGKPVHQFRVRLLRSDGEPIAFAWSAFPDAAPGSDVFYTVGRDITDELRREESLRHSQKMEAVGHLTGGLAHDFNNLLQSVQGAFSLILRRPDDAERVARLATSGLAASERGARLTAQLLTFSRAQRMELKATALAPLIANMEDMLRHSIGPTISITVDPVREDIGVMIDPTQLEMALLNLAINARDAMPNGGDLRIEVRGVSGEDSASGLGDFIEIRVADNGTGMSPEVAAQAFDPFFTTKDVGQGTGLGLSQVYGMATRAGGLVRIDHLAPGTAVTIQLKAASVPNQKESSAGPEASIVGGHRKVLVIDDDEDVRQIVKDLLETIGLEVHVAEDGASGLQLLDQAAPDLVLIDFAMPGMNGAEVAARIRARRPALPILFASGYSDTAAIEAALGPSAQLLRKPFQIADLQAAVEHAMAGQSETLSGS